MSLIDQKDKISHLKAISNFYKFIALNGFKSKLNLYQSHGYCMRNEYKRICIYPKDIALITGKSYRQSIRLLNKIKEDLNKPTNHFVSITEFCQFTGLNYEQVKPLIIG